MEFLKRFLLLFFIILAFGCSKNKKNSVNSKTGEVKQNSINIDIDLTKLSDTIAYATLYDMTKNADKFLGKIVKVSGMFSVDKNEENDIWYFGCMINDATACCGLPIEFVLEGEHNYPEDYPKIGDKITVVGEFTQYLENGIKYYTLKNAKLD